MRVNRFSRGVHQHSQLKLTVRVLGMCVFQQAVHKVRHHLVGHESSGIATFFGVVQICPEMINQILLCQAQVSLGCEC